MKELSGEDTKKLRMQAAGPAWPLLALEFTDSASIV